MVRALLPPHCVLCGGRGAQRDLCDGCAAALPANAPCCAACALPLPHPAAACGACLGHPLPCVAVAAPYRYAWPLDRLVGRFKFEGDLACGAVLASLLAEAVADRRDAVDCVVAMPLSNARLRARGFNQALELAAPVARALGLPIARDALARPRDTSAQSGLDAAARRRNVRGAFAAQRTLAGLRVALVDDVVTTAATIEAASAALLAAGCASVEVWALARAAPRVGAAAQPSRNA